MHIPNPRHAGLLALALAFLLTGCVQPLMLPITPTPAIPTRAMPAPEAATISTATPDVEALTDRLAAEYGMVEDPARNVAARQIEAEAEQQLFVAYTYGPPPDDSTFMHKVSIHAGRAGRLVGVGPGGTGMRELHGGVLTGTGGL